MESQLVYHFLFFSCLRTFPVFNIPQLFTPVRILPPELTVSVLLRAFIDPSSFMSHPSWPLLNLLLYRWMRDCTSPEVQLVLTLEFFVYIIGLSYGSCKLTLNLCALGLQGVVRTAPAFFFEHFWGYPSLAPTPLETQSSLPDSFFFSSPFLFSNTLLLGPHFTPLL